MLDRLFSSMLWVSGGHDGKKAPNSIQCRFYSRWGANKSLMIQFINLHTHRECTSSLQATMEMKNVLVFKHERSTSCLGNEIMTIANDAMK